MARQTSCPFQGTKGTHPDRKPRPLGGEQQNLHTGNRRNTRIHAASQRSARKRGKFADHQTLLAQNVSGAVGSGLSTASKPMFRVSDAIPFEIAAFRGSFVADAPPYKLTPAYYKENSAELELSTTRSTLGSRSTASKRRSASGFHSYSGSGTSITLKLYVVWLCDRCSALP